MMVKGKDASAQTAMLREAAQRHAEIIKELRSDNGKGTSMQVQINFGAVDAIRIVLVTALGYLTAQQFSATIEFMAQEILQNEEEL